MSRRYEGQNIEQEDLGMAKEKLKVGIVSANWGALAHLPAWRLLEDDVEVTAICTSRQETAEAAAVQYDVARPFWDFEAMCADPAIDIIDAGTNPILREKMVATALRAGKHAVNQLPFATSYEAARGLADLQQANGLKGIAAPSVVGLPHLALMKEMIDAGEIGEVFQVQCSWQLSFFLKIYPGFSYTWFGKDGLGVSAMRNQGSHLLHAVRQVFGPIKSIVGRLETQLKQWDLGDGATMAVETDDTAHALLRFANGAMGTLITSWTAADAPGFHIDALGSKGRLRLDALQYPSIATAKLYHGRPDFRMMPSGSDVPVPERLMTVAGRLVEPHESDAHNGSQRVSIARLFEGFVRSIRDGSEPVPDFARAAEVQGVIEAVYQSHGQRAWVDLPA
ncbi:Gfo/Idh/MocA family protein [Sphingobium tyrosinilyticum]|uniref:Gfo/Idh/MocA family protein n=1 Tax=Sphingobium tyrosinilyticum TaxID=2715436 RepID=A0ABV9F6F9_9SPHN